MASCVAFCVLFSRDVFQKVGFLDEIYEGGYFEDVDYSMRVRKAGYICAVSEGAYVYHEQGATMREQPQRLEFFQRNGDHFYKTWNMERPLHVAFVLGNDRTFSGGVVGAEIRRVANEGHQVWVYASPRMVRYVPRHLNVFPIRVNPVFSVGAIFRILTKKKRFHRILVSDPFIRQTLVGCSALHKASVEATPWLQ